MKKGFTLIELLVVIVIIGILATLATVGLNSVRAKARDSKRISDIRQMQSALELYFNDNNSYPTNGDFIIGTPLDSPDGTRTYMSKIPSNPKPWAEGACSSGGAEYAYSYINANSYQLSYCLANKVNDLAAGMAQARPGNINNACTPSCGGRVCGPDGCGGVCLPNSCTLPQTCGGGGTPGVCGCTVIPQATACAGKCGSATASNGCGSTYNCSSTTYCSGSNTCCKSDNITCGNMVDNVVGYFYNTTENTGCTGTFYIHCSSDGVTCNGQSGVFTSHQNACTTCFPGSTYLSSNPGASAPCRGSNCGSGNFACGSQTCQ